MANQALIAKLLKRSEEETKIEVELKGLADTPFYVKLSKEQYKDIREEAARPIMRKGEEVKVSDKVFSERLDALVVARSLHDHNEEIVFNGDLYEALGLETTFDAITAVKQVITFAEEQAIQEAVMECLGFIPKEKVKKEDDELKN
ncbi:MULTISPECIES: hypothetical protein [unclassified Exiguobacterium]|uniref:hypothetical protein n=1 Tax=unclassified Exiguobacterium TaxID=2644629 RepID=UPI0025BF33A2|nr:MULTISPECIES: hypothetical protein [unclassified Exiguobacterium]